MLMPAKNPITSFDVRKVRKDFPALELLIRGKPLVYLDNGASTQKPSAVLEAMDDFYRSRYANVHRGVYELSEKATQSFEETRDKVKNFIHAGDRKEIIFVRGTTEGINLVAHSFARPRLQEGDEVLITAMEHHANIVPWQMICAEKKARLRVVPMDATGTLMVDHLDSYLTDKTRILCVAHVSNALGTINPLETIIHKAHRMGIPVLVDGAQAVPHLLVDMQELGCDFYVFSSHKMYGPTGIGIVYGKKELLEAMSPYQGGGDMISSVTFEKTTYNDLPYKFEAGTPAIAEAIGLGAAIDYLQAIGMESINSFENELLAHAREELNKIPKLKLIGEAFCRSSIFSFTIDGIHPHDIASILDREGIAVRAGHHCAQPVMDFFKIPATVRASLSFYNTREEIDALVRGIYKVLDIFG